MTWLYIPSPYVPEWAASTLPSALPDPTHAASLSWRGKSVQPQALSRAWKRGGFIRLLSGLICEPSTLEHGAARWIASCRATRASPTASPESAAARMTSDGCSTALSTFSIKAGLTPCSARTSRGTPTDSSPLPSRHWKDWAAALRSEFSARARPGRATEGSGSSSWPTATIAERRINRSVSPNARARPTLDLATEQWRSPSDPSKRGGSQHPDKRAAGGHTINLEDQAEHWMTPNAPTGG